MEFGKLSNIEQVNFFLPPDPAGNNFLLERYTKASPHLYIGPTGYNMKPWNGKWYPVGTKDKDFLKCYGKQFNTIEHNTTHYRIPDEATVERWREDTPPDFRFCPKVPQSLSHARDLGISSPELRIFFDRMYDFGDRMGCCFLQLPPYFEPKYLPVLSRFLEKWPAHSPLAVEVRHDAFFNNSEWSNAYFDLLEKHQTVAVITDVAGRRDVCHCRLTAPVTMIRFVGNNLHPTDYSRVDAWAERLRLWTEQGLHTAYFFTHEPDNLLAPELAEYTTSAFQKAMPEAILRGPTPVITPGVQGLLF